MRNLKMLIDCSITADQELTLATMSSLPKAPIMLPYSYIPSHAVRDLWHFFVPHDNIKSCNRIVSKSHCEHPHQVNQPCDQTDILCQPTHSADLDIPPKYEANEVDATEQRPTEKLSAQSCSSTTIMPADKPFRVALIMTRISETYIDSKGALQPFKRLKVNCGSVMVRRDTTEAEFRRLLWECIYDTFELHGWTRAPRTDAELASGKKYATGDEWMETIESLVKEKDGGQDPVLRISFPWKNGKRVKLAAESKLSFSLKRTFDRILGRA